MGVATKLNMLLEVQQAWFKELRHWPKHDVFICITASSHCSWDHRCLIRDLLSQDDIADGGTGFSRNDDGTKSVILDVYAANERRRIWLAEKIEEARASL